MPSPPPDPPRAALEKELEAIEPGGSVTAAAVLTTGAGVLHLLCAGQLWLMFELDGNERLVPAGLLAAAVVFFALIAKIHGQRTWAVVAAIVLLAVSALGELFWIRYALDGGAFSPLQAAMPPLSFAALVCAALALGRCRRATEVRRRARAAGLAFYS